MPGAFRHLPGTSRHRISASSAVKPSESTQEKPGECRAPSAIFPAEAARRAGIASPRLSASPAVKTLGWQCAVPRPAVSGASATGASLPARKSASSARRHSRKPRIASWIAPLSPFCAPRAATDERISSSVFLRSVGGGGAASVIKGSFCCHPRCAYIEQITNLVKGKIPRRDEIFVTSPPAPSKARAMSAPTPEQRC